LVSLNFFLAHAVSDYSFTNPMKLYGNSDWKDLSKHALWSVLVFLAFSFDVVFSSALSVIIFTFALVLHFVIDYLRMRKINSWVVEGFSIVAFLIYSAVFSYLFENSFITSYFSLYLIGMIFVSVIPTQIMRMTGIISELEAESEGISERLAMFVFICADKPLYAILTVLIAFVYRKIIKKEFNKSWWISPLLGFTIPWFFRFIIFG